MTQRPAQLRRVLVLSNFDELLDEVRRLRHDCPSVGNWNAAQVCRHLTDTFNGSIDGFNLDRHRWKRRLLGKLLLRATYQKGIPHGFTVDPALTPPENLNLEMEQGQFEHALRRYREHRGYLRSHPLFGRMSRRQWDRLHLFHSAHHLSFLRPIDALLPAAYSQS